MIPENTVFSTVFATIWRLDNRYVILALLSAKEKTLE